MRLMLRFYRAYPGRTLGTLLALVTAGLAEGVGLSALLPLLNVAMATDGGAAAEPTGEFERQVIGLMRQAGIAPSIESLLVLIVVAISAKSLLLLVANRQVGHSAARFSTDLRLEMLRAVLLSRWDYFLGQPVGKLTNALATEASRSADAFVNGATALAFLLQAVVYGCVALRVNWKATLVGLLAGSFIILLSHSLVRITKKASRRQTNVLISLMSTLTDTLGSVKPLKGMAREHLVGAVLATETARLNRALERQVTGSALLESTQQFLFALVLAGGMYAALVGFGMPFATVMVLIVIVGQMVALLGKVQKQYQKMLLGESAYFSMRATIDQAIAAEEVLHSGLAPQLRAAIRLHGVGFRYGDNPVLDDVDIEIPARALTVLVGPSGSGKTTLVDLLIGLLRPAAGEITIDGTPLDAIDTRLWRRSIGYVPQETILLHDTIAHNVSLGDTEVSDADIERALRAADAWDFVSALPDGVLSNVGERGGKLSGGQRQRIVIARALVRSPQLLILDEATSALDEESAAAVRATLAKLKGELTILAITHQLVMIDVADRVYRLENGRAAVQEG